MSFSAVLIDDEPLALEGLRRFCERNGSVRILGEASDGATGIEMTAAARPDAVFLDIGMPGLGGLDVAARIAAMDPAPLVVFVTAYDHFATQAYDLAVVDYVLKPIEPARLDRAIARIAALAEGDAGPTVAAAEFWVPSRGGMVRIATSSIDRIDADRDYVRISAGGRTHLLRASLGAIEDRLDPATFMRVHRSTILRIDAVAGLEHLGNGAWAATVGGGRVVRIGRRHLASVRSRLNVAG